MACAQHPLAQRNDQTAFLREGNEGARRNHAVLRMPPAQERLETNDLAAKAPLWLVVEFELVALDGGAKILLQRAAFAQPHVHVGLEEADRAARFVLGAIERRIGIREQRGLVIPVRRIDRDADGEGGAQLMAMHVDRICDRGLQPLGQRRGPGRLLRIEADQGELVAAEPRHECAVRPRPRDGGDHAQQFVARRMSEDVIDLLEAVEIERDDRKAFMRGGGALQRR